MRPIAQHQNSRVGLLLIIIGSRIPPIELNRRSGTRPVLCFLAFGARYVTEPQREPSEHIEVVLMAMDEFLERAYQGELRHSHHVASLFFAVRALGRA